jgi:hypothetical protein
MVAIASMGTDASAAMVQGACDVTGVIRRALSSIVNITVVTVNHGDGAAADKPAEDRIAVFAGSGS